MIICSFKFHQLTRSFLIGKRLSLCSGTLSNQDAFASFIKFHKQKFGVEAWHGRYQPLNFDQLPSVLGAAQRYK
jgi:hypothetical protein